jgi:hypothetical protein
MTALDGAACADHPANLWFPDREDDDNEAYGIWGGAGGMRLRALRRAFKTGGVVWETAFQRHLGRLDGNVVELIDANGAAATHGLEATYAKGCRCGPCCLAVSQTRAARKVPLELVGERGDAAEIADRQSVGVPAFLQPRRTA